MKRKVPASALTKTAGAVGRLHQDLVDHQLRAGANHDPRIIRENQLNRAIAAGFDDITLRNLGAFYDVYGSIRRLKLGKGRHSCNIANHAG